MVAHSLGGVIERRQSCDVRQVYAQTSCSIPVVFLLPAASQPQERNSMTGWHYYSYDHYSLSTHIRWLMTVNAVNSIESLLILFITE